jgi:signal transduction histidine kinase
MDAYLDPTPPPEPPVLPRTAGRPGAASVPRGDGTHSRRRASELRLRKLIAATDVMLMRIEGLRDSPRTTLEDVGAVLVPEMADVVRIDLLRVDGCHAAPVLVFSERLGAEEAWARVSDQVWAAIEPALSNETAHLMRLSDRFSISDGGSEGDGDDSAASVQGTLVVAPLLVRGRCAGALTLVRLEQSRRYTSADLAFADALARRISLMLENAELLEMTEAGTRWRQEILGIVAHELRNSLSTIAITAESLRMGWLEGSGNWEAKTTGKRQLELLLGAVGRMKKFVADLLDSVQLESGKLAVTIETVSLAALLGMVRDAHQARATERQVMLELVTPPRVLVKADEHRIAQVISNLVDNALRCTEVGGIVTLSATVLGDEVRVEIRDTGRGIPAAELEHLFSSEWRPRRSREGGHGLGLVIARLIVAAHGGRMGAESEVGRGSTFHFTVPLAEASPGGA